MDINVQQPLTAHEKIKIVIACTALSASIIFTYIFGYNNGVSRARFLHAPYVHFYQCVSSHSDFCEVELFKNLNEVMNASTKRKNHLIENKGAPQT